MPLVDVLDHHHLELARQEDHRQHRQQRQREPLLVGEGLCPAPGVSSAAQLGHGHGPREQVAQAVEQAPGDEHADRQEGQQLDHRLEGDRRDHAFVALGAVEVARAEHDREAGQRQREVQRAVAATSARRAPAARPSGVVSSAIAAGDGLQLQRDVGHDADHGDQRHQPGQQRALAVAAGDEVGDRRDAVAARDADHLAHHHPGQHHRQRRPEVDRQEPHAGRRRAADAAEVGPGGAVHRHRQRVDPGVADDRAALARAPVAEAGHREQQQQVGERRADDAGRALARSSARSRPSVASSPRSTIQASSAISSGPDDEQRAPETAARRPQLTSRSHSASSGKLNSSPAANSASRRCERRPLNMRVSLCRAGHRIGCEMQSSSYSWMACTVRMAVRSVVRWSVVNRSENTRLSAGTFSSACWIWWRSRRSVRKR